jgi:hypothetical protein
VIPRWSLDDRAGYHAPPPAPVRSGPTPATVGATLSGTAVILAGAAVVYLVRYVLLIINRTTLLHPIVAGAAVWLGMLATAVAFVAVIVCWIVLSNWLIARRAAVYARRGRSDPRSPLELWVGCLVPMVNLLWTPVYVIDMARVEEVYPRLRKPIVVWWLLWVLSTAASLFATATSSIAKAASNVVFGTNIQITAQGVADNHVAMVVAYLIATAAVLAVARVYRGFESKPVERPAHHWVVVARDQSAPAVEQLGQEPAA